MWNLTLYSNPFSTNVLLLYPLKTSENLCFSDVFRRYRNGTLVENGLNWTLTFFQFQTDIRSMSIAQWGSDLGKKLIKKLGNLYTKLIWESSTLLTLCTPATDENLSFCDSDMEKLVTNSENSKEGICLMKHILRSVLPLNFYFPWDHQGDIS